MSPPTNKEWQEVLVKFARLEDQLMAVQAWQADYDERSRWLTRTIVAGFITLLIGNMGTFILTVVAWALTFFINRPQGIIGLGGF